MFSYNQKGYIARIDSGLTKFLKIKQIGSIHYNYLTAIQYYPGSCVFIATLGSLDWTDAAAQSWIDLECVNLSTLQDDQSLSKTINKVNTADTKDLAVQLLEYNIDKNGRQSFYGCLGNLKFQQNDIIQIGFVQYAYNDKITGSFYYQYPKDSNVRITCIGIRENPGQSNIAVYYQYKKFENQKFTQEIIGMNGGKGAGFVMNDQGLNLHYKTLQSEILENGLKEFLNLKSSFQTMNIVDVVIQQNLVIFTPIISKADNIMENLKYWPKSNHNLLVPQFDIIKLVDENIPVICVIGQQCSQQIAQYKLQNCMKTTKVANVIYCPLSLKFNLKFISICENSFRILSFGIPQQVMYDFGQSQMLKDYGVSWIGESCQFTSYDTQILQIPDFVSYNRNSGFYSIFTNNTLKIGVTHLIQVKYTFIGEFITIERYQTCQVVIIQYNEFQDKYINTAPKFKIQLPDIYLTAGQQFKYQLPGIIDKEDSMFFIDLDAGKASSFLTLSDKQLILNPTLADFGQFSATITITDTKITKITNIGQVIVKFSSQMKEWNNTLQRLDKVSIKFKENYLYQDSQLTLTIDKDYEISKEIPIQVSESLLELLNLAGQAAAITITGLMGSNLIINLLFFQFISTDKFDQIFFKDEEFDYQEYAHNPYFEALGYTSVNLIKNLGIIFYFFALIVLMIIFERCTQLISLTVPSILIQTFLSKDQVLLMKSQTKIANNSQQLKQQGNQFLELYLFTWITPKVSRLTAL
eukprot:403336164